LNIGPQKIHNKNVLRIGGICIFISALIGPFFTDNDFNDIYKYGLLIILCSIPAFIVGLIEDITKKIGVLIRLIGVIVSAVLVYYLVPIKIYRFGYNIIDLVIFSFGPLSSFTITLFSITGLTNAYNIIDGLNGLASMVAILTLSSIGYVSLINNDPIMLGLALMMIGSIIGFFIFNFPYGLFFLGDCGAYLLGFYIACLSILLVQRHESISPFYALVVNGYPVFETIFSIWRRKILRGGKSMIPDGLHFHSLIYRRFMKWESKGDGDDILILKNSKTSIYLWAFSCLSILPATLFWNNSNYLIYSGFFFCLIYMYIYKKIILFKI